jgi:hypothetical protein
MVGTFDMMRVAWYIWSMPKRSSKKKPRDLSLLAASTVGGATTEDIEPEGDEGRGKNPHAVALGRLGGLKGGRARAARLAPEERRQIARKAAEARWRSK